MQTFLWLAGAAAVLWVLDRLLLGLESRGWINYRRHGMSRGGATYHALELQSMFNPSTRNVMEVKYGEQEEVDESGAPPGEGGEPGAAEGDRESNGKD